ncbi:MAG: MgtC/SapB family protein [Campylobacteraceae bacterium]|nr:MgtC/SapB family protein [Campylobacteraceae bacterium]
MDLLIFQNIIIAMVIGFSIGLQREMNILYANRRKDFGGARTFSMIGLIGYLSALLSVYIPFFTLMATLFFGTLLIVVHKVNSTPEENGITTELSAFVTFLIGVLLAFETTILCIFVTIAVLIVLNSKDKIQQFEKVIEKKDLSAAIIFLMMTFVILPILPDKPIDPWGYFNPYTIWMMVVLVAGISFFGYICVRILGVKHGIGLEGFFGGLVSSTAVTLSLGRQGKENPSLSKNIAIGISLACSLMLIRVFFELYVVNPELAKMILIPIVVATLIGYTFLGYLYFTTKNDPIAQKITFKNPFKLSEALMLGAFFGVVIALITFANDTFGNSGVYVISFISGVADVDAVVLSLASFAKSGISSTIVLNGTILAILSNSLVKFAIVAILGNRETAIYVGSYLFITIFSFITTYRGMVL